MAKSKSGARGRIVRVDPDGALDCRNRTVVARAVLDRPEKRLAPLQKRIMRRYLDRAHLGQRRACRLTQLYLQRLNDRHRHPARQRCRSDRGQAVRPKDVRCCMRRFTARLSACGCLPGGSTLPAPTSRQVPALSMQKSGVLPLYAKLEVRATTLRPAIFERSVVVSSLIPSEKYSCSGSFDMLFKGSTAIEGRSSAGAVGTSALAPSPHGQARTDRAMVLSRRSPA